MINFHTHIPQPDAIVNIDLSQGVLPDTIGVFGYSVGIHPWSTATATEADFERVVRLAALPEVVMIGECGLDALRGAPMYRQEPIFEQHVELSEELEKPLLIHCVKAYNQLINIHKRKNPSQRWIVHGFRGNDTIAAQLMNRGIALSFGPHFNVAALRATRLDHLLVETDDDADTPIEAVYECVADALGVDADFVARVVANNVEALFPSR